MAKTTRPTISDVAKAAKTGKTSISRYLNGEKHLLSDALLARIEHAIAELDYRPSLMARNLKHGRTRLIGLIIADITNPYSVHVLSGIEAACREKASPRWSVIPTTKSIRSCTTWTCCVAIRWKASW
jgi:LacI family kdg operon repressor